MAVSFLQSPDFHMLRGLGDWGKLFVGWEWPVPRVYGLSTLDPDHEHKQEGQQPSSTKAVIIHMQKMPILSLSSGDNI